MDIEEIWLPVRGYEGIYEVSNLGRVRQAVPRFHTGYKKIMKPSLTTKYVKITLSKRGKPKTFNIHVLVARSFLGEPPRGCEVNHKDTNKLNNRADNLEHITHKKNMEHAKANSLLACGDKNGLRLHPESASKGKRHSDIMKVVAARGANHPLRKNPEKASRGKDHYYNKHPEKIRRGEENSFAKLTDADIRQIRASEDGQAEIAIKHGVHKSLISLIKRNKIWKHVH